MVSTIAESYFFPMSSRPDCYGVFQRKGTLLYNHISWETVMVFTKGGESMSDDHISRGTVMVFTIAESQYLMTISAVGRDGVLHGRGSLPHYHIFPGGTHSGSSPSVSRTAATPKYYVESTTSGGCSLWHRRGGVRREDVTLLNYTANIVVSSVTGRRPEGTCWPPIYRSGWWLTMLLACGHNSHQRHH